MKKVLLHICCANCACYPVKTIREKGLNVTGYWYNPNIHPFTEFQKRISAAGYYASRAALEMIYREEYGLVRWLEEAGRLKEIKERCSACYRLRVFDTARTAKENGFDYFSSTLLYSKKQNYDMISAASIEAAGKYGVEFYGVDFSEGWNEGIKLSQAMGLYRQNYCGCIFSEQEKYAKK
jgi:hypothetical protein